MAASGCWLRCSANFRFSQNCSPIAPTPDQSSILHSAKSCPTSKPKSSDAPIDLFIVSHHGGADSNTEVLTHAIHPRVAILNNGTRKGGEPDALRRIYSSPGLENLWQLHFSLYSGQEYTVPGMFIANRTDEVSATMPVAPMARSQVGPGAPPAPSHSGPAHWIK